MQSRRDHLRLLLSLGLGMSGVVHGTAAHAQVLLPPVGVLQLRGSVALNGRRARLGDVVGPDDRIVTGPQSSAVYTVGDNAFLQRAGSDVVFGNEPAVSFFRLVSGALLSVFGTGGKRLQTPTATIGIRGTACYLEAAPTRSYVCLCYGQGDVVPNVDPANGELVRSRHHDHPLFVHDAPGMPAMADGPLVNHSDAELSGLEALFGRTPPFLARA